MVTLQRLGDTCWGSHYKSVSNLIKLFSLTCEVLLKIMNEGNSSQKVEAKSAYEVLISLNLSSSCILLMKLWGSRINFVKLCKTNRKTF